MEPQELTGAVVPPEPDEVRHLTGTHGELVQRAIAVLDANWMGHATRASARLYPHQWSWDSACIAIGYSTWDQARAQADPPTSGIVQPPVHATAVWKVFRRAHDADEAKAFLRELQPKLAAWHDYLYRERTRGDDGLVEIWHPWESGMDNSPLWDTALERITLPPEAIPEYQRVDVEFVDAAQRPTNDHYDRYAYLVKLYRDLR